MLNLNKINILDYDYDLPDEKIAKQPVNKRDNSNLLVWKNNKLSKEIFSDLHNFIPENKILFLNNTKVIQARLNFTKDTGAKIEIFCLEPYNPVDYNLAFQQTKNVSWKCLIGNSKKWKTGILKKKVIINETEFNFFANKILNDNKSNIIEFSWDNNNFSFSEILENLGEIPIPPYLNRKSSKTDITNYQTTYSKIKGSVAAPTAGLHFTSETFNNLLAKNIKTDEITLHVGAGTFKPVSSNNIIEHEMHTEHFYISLSNINNLINNINDIYAVGTTTVRTIESLFFIGLKLKNNCKEPFYIKQWDAYNLEKTISPKESLIEIKNFLTNKNIEIIEAKTQIIIVPGYKFNFISGLVTNFHQPKSTLLLLISAFVGSEKWKEIYKFALSNNFRFLSYGDSSLLIP